MALIDLLKWCWNWLDGKKTLFAGLGFIAFGLIGLALHLLEKDQAVQHILTGAALLGIGGKVQKLIDVIKRIKK